ncbi:type IX secretion system membrane protein PorP/SprF [Muricauda oceani]|uniref:Type IX secretion system membrane protein PorP/SprF n=1 Tax=Flagellimonas oceani TaxID=2698672 RepID=A0A6G7J0U1_9FLAO|nr:type IX secretion system membrane protein PorP/SprF [Allomuricauda oceani]MBW8245097.1 type IX secretion system membrane protein PorP/SprF [Allomuricauda oceani]QII44184.1 type IX secretion system membrane protein PorP/SprF [Allomuricauda oceani]
MKRIIFLNILIWSMISSITVTGQQDPQYTQYMLNTQVINPALVGSRGVTTIGALYRAQWLGLDGAPTTQTLHFNTPLSEKVGIGFSVVNDEIGNGTSQETFVDASFSYSLPVSNYANLSFGIKASANILNVDFSQLVNYGAESNLPNIDNKFSPNFGVGVFYNTERFYAGLSVPRILETEHFDNSSQNTYLASEQMNFYLISGFVFDLNPGLKLRPGMLMKAVQGAPLSVDISASLLFNETFSFGAAYRLDSAVSALFGFQVTEKFLLGLSYDWETTELGSTQFNDGSFEVFLRFDFLNRYNRNNAGSNFF